MIKKEELRLGSLVLMKETFGYDEWELYVCKLSEDELDLANRHGIYVGVKWENIEPLQIFYWHLEAVGFAKASKEIYTLQDWEYNCTSHIATWKGTTNFNIRNVHQLQNLLLSISEIDLDYREVEY